MMLAAIDAGSNTLRLLIGSVVEGRVVPEHYLRRICRLAGGFSQETGLAPDAKERTLLAFMELADVCRKYNARQVKAVGTAAFRQAVNGKNFCREIRAATGLPLDIINGELEAEYMASGVLSALDPVPSQSLIIDIGGGSTEFVLCLQQKVLWSQSLPLGVVRLTEGYLSAEARHKAIDEMLSGLTGELEHVCTSEGIDCSALVLVGTAGSVTTLAALDMQMAEYDWRKVNNYSLSLSKLQQWQKKLAPLSPLEREALPGMEAGRGDLIVSGLEIVLCLMNKMCADSLMVSDFGILEGLLLSLQNVDIS